MSDALVKFWKDIGGRPLNEAPPDIQREWFVLSIENMLNDVDDALVLEIGSGVVKHLGMLKVMAHIRKAH